MSEFTCTCPACLSSLTVDQNYLGFEITCPQCSHTFPPRAKGYNPKPATQQQPPRNNQKPATSRTKSEGSTGEPWENLTVTLYAILSLILPTIGLIAAVIGVCDRAKRVQAGYLFGAIIVGLHINAFYAYHRMEAAKQEAIEEMQKIQRQYDAELKRLQEQYDL